MRVNDIKGLRNHMFFYYSKSDRQELLTIPLHLTVLILQRFQQKSRLNKT